MNNCDQYLATIKKNLPVHDKQTKRYIRDMELRVSEYLEDKPDASYLELVRDLGDPNEVVESYITDLDPKELITDRKKYIFRFIVMTINVIIIAYVISLFSIFIYIKIHSYQFQKSYIQYDNKNMESYLQGGTYE